MELHDFGWAIRELKKSNHVMRHGWNGKNMYLYLEDQLSAAVQRGEIRPYEPCIVMYTAQGKHQPGWLASQNDMLAEDWEIRS